MNEEAVLWVFFSIWNATVRMPEGYTSAHLGRLVQECGASLSQPSNCTTEINRWVCANGIFRHGKRLKTCEGTSSLPNEIVNCFNNAVCPKNETSVILLSVFGGLFLIGLVCAVWCYLKRKGNSDRSSEEEPIEMSKTSYFTL